VTAEETTDFGPDAVASASPAPTPTSVAKTGEISAKTRKSAIRSPRIRSVLVTGMASVTVASLRRYVTVVSTLIKGVPGRIFQKLLQLYLEQHRQEFTNKEIRHDPSLKLPEFQDNLEARLVLLRRRLEERTDVVRLDHVGRGRLRLSVVRPVRLKVEV
jgi:hypothetical protein